MVVFTFRYIEAGHVALAFWCLIKRALGFWNRGPGACFGSRGLEFPQHVCDSQEIDLNKTTEEGRSCCPVGLSGQRVEATTAEVQI